MDFLIHFTYFDVSFVFLKGDDLRKCVDGNVDSNYVGDLDKC